MTRKKSSQVAPGIDTNKLLIAAIVALAVGYYMLNHIATWEDPPLGNTFHIIFGCIFIAASAIAFFMIIKTKYFPKKKKKSSKPVFLDEDLKRRSRHRRN